jgi:hypothetical protein
MNKEIRKQIEAQIGFPFEYIENKPATIAWESYKLIERKKIELEYANEERKGIIIPEIAALTEIAREHEIKDVENQIEVLSKRLRRLKGEIL